METTTTISNNKKQSGNGIVLACSGGSDLGELTDRVARKLRENKVYNMKCLAMVAADNKELIKSLQTSDVLVIDGCPIDCGKKIMEEAWLSDYSYIRLTDMGYQKGNTPVSDELVNSIYNQITNNKTGDKIIHNKPVFEPCCNEETCDMFDFMSNHVGFKILHPGGTKATNTLLSKLPINNKSRVLDIACGKGRTSVQIAKKYGCKVVGIDILENSIEEARLYAKKHGVEKLVSFQVADAKNLPFFDNEFDVTIAQAMLILIEDKNKVIQEAARVLKPGGISGWLELSWKQAITKEFQENASNEICAKCISNVITFQEWEGTFKNNGFIEVNISPFDMNYSGMSGMIKDEGIGGGIFFFYKYLSNTSIRKRMIKLDNFFKKYPEFIGFGIYISKK